MGTYDEENLSSDRQNNIIQSASVSLINFESIINTSLCDLRIKIVLCQHFLLYCTWIYYYMMDDLSALIV